MVRYRLTRSILVVTDSGMGMHLKQVAAGKVVATPDNHKQNGLVEVVCEGRSVSLFIEDLIERAERVKACGAD